MKPKSKVLKGLSTISAFSLQCGADRRTIQRRLLNAGIQSVCQVGRSRLYRLKDLEAAAVAPHDSQSDDRASLHYAKLRQLVLKNAAMERQLRGLLQRFTPRCVASGVFTKFVNAFMKRHRAATKSLVETVRATPDTSLACEVARNWMLDLWGEMAKGEWFNGLNGSAHLDQEARELDALEAQLATIKANVCPDCKPADPITAANSVPADPLAEPS